MPNLSETISETHRLIQERLDNSPVLTDWWQAQGSHQFAPHVDDIVGVLSEFGDYLGDELAVSGYATGPDGFGGPLVLAEVVDTAGLRGFIEERFNELAGMGVADGHLVFVEDPLSPPATGPDVFGGDQLFLWLGDSLAVASPDAAQLARIGGIVLRGEDNPFTDTEFYAAISERYNEGAEILIAVDLEEVVAAATAEDGHGTVSEHHGFLNARHLMLEQKRMGDQTHHRAVLSFSEARSGVASWLAAPAPMGSLDFISPDAQLVAAFVFKDPVKLLDDLYAMSDGGLGPLAELEERHGFSLRDDVAAALGGEFALALDGPLLILENSQ